MTYPSLLKVTANKTDILAEKIADGHGAIVSEFPLQTSPDRKIFSSTKLYRRSLVACAPSRRVP